MTITMRSKHKEIKDDISNVLGVEINRLDEIANTFIDAFREDLPDSYKPGEIVKLLRRIKNDMQLSDNEHDYLIFLGCAIFAKGYEASKIWG